MKKMLNYPNQEKIQQHSTQLSQNVLSGSMQVEGCYKCCNCSQKVYLECNKLLPKCPRCNCSVFEVV